MISSILPPGVVYHPSAIHAYDVQLRGYNGDIVPGYVARPSSEGPHPGLVLVHGIHGYEEHMKDVARRFAVMGYAAIVPALYSRNEGLCVIEEEDMAKARDWLGRRSNVQANADLEAAKEFLRASSFVGDHVGLVGFCSGGRVAMVFASNTIGVDAFVNFYSNGVFQPTEVNPTPAGEMVKDLCCPMLGLFGDDDTNPSPGDVARLRAELDKHGKDYEFVSYKNAGHAFFSDTRESYRPAASYMAWGRCLEWLSRYLKP